MLLNDLVIDTTSPLLAPEKPTPPHEHQMLRRHVAGYSACVSKLTDGVLALQHELNHSEPMGMSDRPQALSGLAEDLKAQQSAWFVRSLPGH